MDVAAAAKLKPDDRKTPPAADAAIEISGLSLRFDTADGPVQALSDVSLRVARGEFVSFIGPSGCGKTTLLRAVADLENPTSGSIRVNAMSPREARANRAYGYVFQAPALYPWRSVARNIALPLEIMGFSKAERDARIAKGLELVNLSGFGGKISLAIVRRHAAARVDRAGFVVRPRSSPDGRAVRRARRDRARHAEPAIAAPLGRDGQDGAVRHPLDSGSGVPVDAHRRHVAHGRAASTMSSNAIFPATARWTSARRLSFWRSPTGSGRACARDIPMTDSLRARPHPAALCAPPSP